jgi:hypothetical protein
MPDTIANPPTLSIEHNKNAETKYLEAHYYTHMSETQAKAEIDVSRNRYAVPARQETYRFLAVVALIVMVLVYLLPVFVATNPNAKTVGLVIVASLAILGAKPAIDAIVKAFKGS